MKRKIFNQLSLLLAIVAVAISLSACGTQKTLEQAPNSVIETNNNQEINNTPDYNQSEAPSPRTKQS